jgi:hypothetical protein
MVAEFKNWPANNIWRLQGMSHGRRLAHVELWRIPTLVVGEHEIYAMFPLDSCHHFRL